MIRVLIAGLTGVWAVWGALPAGVEVVAGAVNRAGIGGGVYVYGDAPGRAAARVVLFTHGRRDVAWAGEAAVRAGARGYAPEAERTWFEKPGESWAAFEAGRFHDYAQQTTKVPVAAMAVHRFVKGGDVIEEGGQRIEVLDTPGYSPGAVTYLVTVGGKRIAFTGDLIWGDGQLLDLYSLQDAVAETKTRGYHGYAARAGALMESLRRVAAAKPDVLIPARGPVIENPQQAMERLTARLKAILQSHFSTDALRWYWGYESLRQRARSAGLTEGVAEVMSFAEERRLPEWVLAIGNSRVLVSRSGGAFLIDGGYRPIQAELEKLREAGRFQRLEGIWVTHYHDDHTDYVQSVARAFDAPVHFSGSIRDILENPGSYRMPASTHNPIRGGGAKRDRETMRWREYELQFFDFPGQTLYHGGLRVTPPEGPALFFAGDSFTPAGMDDYCLLNRNLLREGKGYLYCLDVLAGLGGTDWIINQHVDPMFRYTAEQIAYMRRALRARRALTAELTPLPGADFAVDESWARVYPYATEAKAGERVRVELRIYNHSDEAREFRVKWNLPAGWRMGSEAGSLRVGAAAEGAVAAEFVAGAAGLAVVTADVGFGGVELVRWTEGMVRVR